MNSVRLGPTVSRQPLQFDRISGAPFPRIARIDDQPDDVASGTLLGRVDLSESMLTATAYAPHLRLTQHAHASAFILFVQRGSFLEQHGSRAEHYDRFSCIFRPRLDEHANDFDDCGALLLAVDVSARWLDRLREAGFDGERTGIRSPFVQQFADRVEAELKAPDELSETVVEALVIEVLAHAWRRSRRTICSRKSVWLERARRLIENEFASSLSLGGVASAVGVHPVHLAREFRAAYGCTVGEYLRNVRVSFAREQLAMTGEALSEIALLAGFADQSQLTKCFKRVTGQTPAAYRAKR
jgi:AraC-like DNA-binding protein